MSYLWAAAFFPLALGFLFLQGMREERRRKASLRESLLHMEGKPPAARSGGPAPDGYLRTLHPAFAIDAVTWKDLEMDAVFRRLDYTRSQAGREYLYACLHCPAAGETEAARWEGAVSYFLSHPEQRIAVQMLLSETGWEKGMDFHRCLAAMERMNVRRTGGEYAALAAYAVSVFCMAWSGGVGFCLLAGVMIVQVIAYFRRRAGMLPHLRMIAWLLRMVHNMEKLCRVLEPAVRSELEQNLHTDMAACGAKLRGLRRRSFWVMQSGAGNRGPFAMIGDYIRMLFHVDLIQFASLQKKILSLRKEIGEAYACMGYADSCISIAMYRLSLRQYCIPCLYDIKDAGNADNDYAKTGGLHAVSCVHPLLEHPVPNSIEMTEGRGVLLTGSNASGKSTFLQTIAVNLLLSQTIHTALAERFSAPFCRLYTAMADGKGRSGDIQTGESSYMAEILSLKRILDAGKDDAAPVFCFVDEILRGTGTVERIAASAWILKAVRPPRMLCFAATHDRELTGLLADRYDSYYFSEEITDGDIHFPYRLLRGVSQTGNAIKLLEAVGYESEIVEGAARQAAAFAEEGIWK